MLAEAVREARVRSVARSPLRRARWGRRLGAVDVEDRRAWRHTDAGGSWVGALLAGMRAGDAQRPASRRVMARGRARCPSLSTSVMMGSGERSV
jgi:hypothetical protein